MSDKFWTPLLTPMVPRVAFVSLAKLCRLTSRGQTVTCLFCFVFPYLKDCRICIICFLNIDDAIHSCQFLSLTFNWNQTNPEMSGDLTCGPTAVSTTWLLPDQLNHGCHPIIFAKMQVRTHAHHVQRRSSCLSGNQWSVLWGAPVSGDEAPRTLEQTSNQPHLTTAVKTLTA